MYWLFLNKKKRFIEDVTNKMCKTDPKLIFCLKRDKSTEMLDVGFAYIHFI